MGIDINSIFRSLEVGLGRGKNLIFHFEASLDLMAKGVCNFNTKYA